MLIAENERLPTELGWSRREEVVSLVDIAGVTQMISNATNLITPSKESRASRRQDLHSGLGF